ncbi:glycosyltransferase [Stenotrophomonas sp. TWI700]|uniref:glycosyltransferase n=1 Tax=unclassified Stenotrophomonas TaxID=196198 RepID=UPI0028AEF08E|nr:glycosyltransferase [Stenotrophomonas sp.]
MERLHAEMDVTLVSTADWDNPYWTNKQHMAVEFARRGQKVLYIESQGLRAPTATKKDFARIVRRLSKGLRPPRQVRDNLWVWSPLVIPFHGSAFVRSINRWILEAGVRFWQFVKGVRPDLLWTYSPMTTKFYDLARYRLVVYHAVDDIKTQPGMPRSAIELAEAELSSRADVIFVTAKNLYLQHSKLNSNTHYLSNVADFYHFNAALDASTVVPEDISIIPRPRIGFVGAISSYKIDFELVRKLASERPNWSFVFIGEVGEGDPLTDSSLLSGLPNVYFLGGRAYSSLPGFLKGIDVAIQPNKLNEYTQSMFPMKFFEYLAAGRSVVSVDLPALSEYREVAHFSTSSSEFLLCIERALAGAGPSLEVRLAAARKHTYEQRMDRMYQILDELKSS